MPEHLFPPDVAIRINAPILLFSAGLALMTAVLFGLVPALQMAKPEISQVMQSNSNKAAGSVRGKRLHGTLVAAQIALTLLLLTAAGAAIQSFVRLTHVPLGYDPGNVVAVDIPLQENTYTTWQARVNYFEQLRASIAALPESDLHRYLRERNAALYRLETELRPTGTACSSAGSTNGEDRVVDSSYFGTLHMPLLRGTYLESC